ncbi:Der GTPase-activating protein YihI [Paraglaciecola polaris]|uniref:Der GTPase-activating protein YihI n=1 Tax=Paraglaciecola polaris TaxID=222814 RepID=UPI0030ED1FB0|tara:strand:- start:5985 stop:6494 length:510 start_codon:yes stop_codon:yes gene_type:complete
MPRKKKSRKIGQIGTPLAPKVKRKPAATAPKRNKKTLGKPSGTRNNPEQTSTSNKQGKSIKDPRIGSKKPIPLIIDDAPRVKTAKPKFFSPAQELESIEQNERFGLLLEKLDADESLSKEERIFVNKLTARHQELCDLLGIANEDDSAADPSEDDLYAQFESIDINKFK